MARLANGLNVVHCVPATRWILLACWLITALAGLRHADAAALSSGNGAEQEIKAAYLFKFCSYVEWPESAFKNADSAFMIGIMDEDVVADALASVTASRTIHGRPVVVRKMRRDDSVEGLHVLFVGRSNKGKFDEILAAAKKNSILTVTESNEGLPHGSMINFVFVDGKIRFEIAPKTAEQNHLTISARLLAVAYKVAPGVS